MAENRSIRIVLFLCLFMLHIFDSAAAQDEGGSVTGFLYDSETLEPLASANIYLSKTTLGTTSDPTGYFELRNVPRGKYNLIFRFLGYSTKQYSVELRENVQIDLKNVFMDVNPIEMKHIDVISTKPGNWTRNLNSFTSVFIGNSSNAALTEITNPEVLEFSNENGNLIASHEEELHIINRSLGYELYVTLTSFSWNMAKGEGKYFFTARMNELRSENENQKKTWAENRSRTYRGSLRHFFQLLVEDNVEKQFRLLNGNIELIAEGSGRYEGTYVYKVNSIDGKTLQVEHRRRNQSELIVHEDRWLYLDLYGNLMNPETMMLSGYWSTHRVADFLPFNYRE